MSAVMLEADVFEDDLGIAFTPSLNLGIDIDDVLYPWYHEAEKACEAAKITNGKKATSWRMHEDYGCTLDEWKSALHVGLCWGGMYEADPIPGVINSLQDLKDAGHRLHLVTARGFFDNGDIIRRKTVEWLYDKDVPHDSLTFTKDKTIARMDVFVDDAPHNVEALRQAGIHTYLSTSPHNIGVIDKFRVADFNHFADIILGR